MKNNKSDILSRIGKDAGFNVPEGYFDSFTSQMESKLPKQEVHPIPQPTKWQKIRPFIYMAAMFVGAALIIRVASPGKPASEPQQLAADETDIELEYISTAIENTMMDDYSLYVYLTDESAE